MKSIVTENQPIYSAKVLELKRKISDRRYLDSAVNRIAFVLSRQISEADEGQGNYRNGAFRERA
ncbi:MAG: hypothetical protein Ta2A_07010 [Treponemataceae bacterium]|nr:MAG: hypothetical protein Ta2A_07010 [Treponemataceae bacterium]